MIEYSATSVGYAPVKGDWRKAVGMIFAELRQHFGISELALDARWAWVDPSQHVIADCTWFHVAPEWYANLANVRLPAARRGHELWLSIDGSMTFPLRSYPLDIRVRVDVEGEVHVELRFTTVVHMDIFRRDVALNEFNLEAKAALMRLLVEVARRLGSDAFAYQLAPESSLLGSPSQEKLLDHFDFLKLAHLKDPYYVAGIRSELVPPGLFEPDDSKYPWQYRRAGYDIFDSLWPAGSIAPAEET